MEKVSFVENGELDEVNEYIKCGEWSIKAIYPVAESVSIATPPEADDYNHLYYEAHGNVYAYVVITKNYP